MREIILLSQFFMGLKEIAGSYNVEELYLSPGYDSEEDMHFFSYLPQLEVHEDLSLLFIKLELDVSLCESCAQIIKSETVFKKSDSLLEFLQRLPDNCFSEYLLAQKLNSHLELKNQSPKNKI